MLQTSMVFINNTAEVDGAAIYATDIQQCVYTPTLESLNDSSTVFEGSIFNLSPQFSFMYVHTYHQQYGGFVPFITYNIYTCSGNRVLNPAVNRSSETLATAPFELLVEPQV